MPGGYYYWSRTGKVPVGTTTQSGSMRVSSENPQTAVGLVTETERGAIGREGGGRRSVAKGGKWSCANRYGYKMHGQCNYSIPASSAFNLGGSFWLIALLVGLILVPSCHTDPTDLAKQEQLEQLIGHVSSAQTQQLSMASYYGIVIDAGSSGTRMRIYRWAATSQCWKLPAFVEIVNFKRTPGISSFINNLDGLRDYLNEILIKAKETVPGAVQKRTSLYLMATAGMRLLMAPNANKVMAQIQSLLEDKTFNPFKYEPRNSRILSGEEEGAFAWVAVNYLSGFLTGTTKKSVGIMELGGASTQIAFLPEGAILADKWPMEIGQKMYAIYVHSYLYYGQELAVIWIKEHLIRIHPSNTTIINPCMLTGDTEDVNLLNKEVKMIGTSDPDGCQKLIDVFVYKSPEYNCHPKPCAISNVYQPAIPQSKHFYALSAFLFNLKDIQALDEQGKFTPESVTESARTYCSKTFSEVKEDGIGKEAFFSSNCLMGLYMPTLFTKGYGFSPSTNQIRALKKLNNTSLEWSLGAIIYEHEQNRDDCVGTSATVSSVNALHSPVGTFRLTSVSVLVALLLICVSNTQ